jgi:hypothetical protein
MRSAIAPLVVAAAAVQAVASESSGALPVNQWTLLPAKTASPSPYNPLIYAPDRGLVLRWNWSGSTGKDAMLAFHPVKGDWAAHGPGAPPGEKTDEKTGRLQIVSNGVCWDSKRKEVVYTLPGRMLAYNPETRQWRDLKTKTLLDGFHGPAVLANHFYEGPALVLADSQPGPPPCYGLGTCYDPVNDEILLFPHFGAANLDMVKVNGSITGHLGTMVYSFQDNAWRRTGHTFGSEPVKKASKTLIELIGKVSRATDDAWALRRVKARRELNSRPPVGWTSSPSGLGDGLQVHPTRDGLEAHPTTAEQTAKTLSLAVTAFDALSITPDAKPVLAKARAPLREAAAAAAAGKWDEVLAAGGRALWVFDEAMDGPLRVEPGARCGTPLVYDPKNQVIVMFGGHSGLVRHDLWAPGQGDGSPGRLNDTWLYDCHTKQWRDASTTRRPRPTLWPKLAYDPASGLVLLATWEAKQWDDKSPRTVTLWGFDAAKAEWAELDRQPWTGPLWRSRHGAGLAEIALDPSTSLLVLTQQPEDGRGSSQTWAFKLDVSKMSPKPAPVWNKPAPLRPQQILPDEPAVLAKLKTLPANKWFHMHPPHDGVDKGWGNAACDPVRGHVYYFGGGHSTYQVNDVAIYSPGANQWAYAAGDHNDWIPPIYWDGVCMGLRGGPPAGHQRNYYCVVDGRMYAGTGAESRRWGAETARLPGRRYSWFYDLDRGGVWRRLEIGVVDRQREEDRAQAQNRPRPGVYGKPNLATPDGRILGFGGGLEPYNGRFFPGESYFSSLDTLTNQLTVRKPTSGPRCCPGEDRPVCYIAGRDHVFYYEYAGSKDKPERQCTWVYDVKNNAFADLKPRRQPPGSARTVEYIVGQDAVFAVIGEGQPWVYSFQQNTWTPLALETDAPMGFASPYAQAVYSARYGVLVNVGASSRGTAVMRPDFSAVR